MVWSGKGKNQSASGPCRVYRWRRGSVETRWRREVSLRVFLARALANMHTAAFPVKTIFRGLPLSLLASVACSPARPFSRSRQLFLKEIMLQKALIVEKSSLLHGDNTRRIP